MTCVGTPLYMAPEVSKAERYDSRCDQFSVGLVTRCCKGKMNSSFKH